MRDLIVKIDPEDYRGPLPNPISVLEELLARVGLSLIEATLRYSFFIAPEAVRAGVKPATVTVAPRS